MSFVFRLAAIALIATLSAPAVAAAQTTTTAEHTLSVIGRGQVELRPDRGSFTTVVTRLSRSANKARSRANARVNAIVGGLGALEIERDQITTSQVSLRRERHRVRKDGPVHIRFRADVVLRVAVDGLARLGRAIDVASQRGATDIFGPQLSFSGDRRAAGRLRSEAAALRDARTRAEAAAALEGQQIVGVQSIDLNPGQSDFRAFALDAASGGRSAREPVRTQILTAKRKLTAQAAVTYVIEPAA